MERLIEIPKEKRKKMMKIKSEQKQIEESQHCPKRDKS